jgi:hypothetical protein
VHPPHTPVPCVECVHEPTVCWHSPTPGCVERWIEGLVASVVLSARGASPLHDS